MGRGSWHVSALTINFETYHVGQIYNTPNGLMRLECIDTVNEEFRFTDIIDNFVTIKFVEFI